MVLENSNQFHRWHTELEAARTLETEEKYQQYAETLRGNLSMLEGLQSKVVLPPKEAVGVQPRLYQSIIQSIR